MEDSSPGGPNDEFLDRPERKYHAIVSAPGAREERAWLAFLTATSCRRLGGEDFGWCFASYFDLNCHNREGSGAASRHTLEWPSKCSPFRTLQEPKNGPTLHFQIYE
jgi:hypothetical protein